MKTLFASVLALASFEVGLAYDSASSPSPLPAIVQQAYSAADALPDGGVWRFTLTASMGEHGGFTGHFDGSLDEGEQWVLVSPDTPDAMSEVARDAWVDMSSPDDDDPNETDDEVGFSVSGGDSGLFFGSDQMSMVGSVIRELRESDNQIVYGFDPDLTGEEEEPDAMTLTMNENLTGELTVSRDGPTVESIRIFAPESFKPNIMARINAFEMVLEFSHPPSLPAPVLNRLSTHIEISALMQNVTQTVEFSFSDLEYTAP